MSILFVDLVGFTAESEKLDPEDVRAFLTPYYERVRAELGALRRPGGEVHRRRGDGGLRRADRIRRRRRASRSRGVRDPRLGRARRPGGPDRRQHGRGDRRARRAPRARRGDDRGRRREHRGPAPDRGSGRRRPRRRGDVHGHAQRDRVPPGAAGRREGEGARRSAPGSRCARPRRSASGPRHPFR